MPRSTGNKNRNIAARTKVACNFQNNVYSSSPDHLRNAQFTIEITQGCAQGFFDDRMVERHFEHLRNRHFVLQRPGEQMRQMFGGRCLHFRSQELAAGEIAVDIQ